MRRYIILVVFLLATVISALFISKVKVNYNLEKYLPSNSDVKQGLDVYASEFGASSTAIFSFDETDLTQALSVKNEIMSLDNVGKVIFLDDYLNPVTFDIILANATPTEQGLLNTLMDNLQSGGMTYLEAFIRMVSYLPDDAKTHFEEIIARYKSDREVLMQVVLETSAADKATETTIDAIGTLLVDHGYTYHSAGTAVSQIFTRNTIEREVLLITLICIPIMLVVMLVLSRAYLDILLFGIVVGVSVIINLGTNALLPDISFITKAMAIVLQIAISLDYVIFMINAYHLERMKGTDVDTSIEAARHRAKKPIIASALTTGVSFLALIFMRFSIGLDIGIVFAKAILISLLSTIFLLPVLLHYFAKAIDKTTKRTKSLFSGKFAEKLHRFRYLFLALLLVVLAGSLYVQTQATYTYGSASFAGSKGTSYYEDMTHIEDTFGKTNTVLILMPKDDAEEAALYNGLSTLDYVDSLQAGIYYKLSLTDPLIIAQATQGFYSEHDALIQFNLESDYEGDQAFTYYENIRQMIDDLGIQNAHILGETAVAYNIRETVSLDYNLVLVIALVAVMIIILVTFRNLLMPVLLPLVIETSVFFTMAMLFFIDNQMVFLAVLIVSAILLGVTIDYAILLSKSYMEARESEDQTKSIRLAIRQSTPSIITSATLFSISGLTISLVSSIQTIAQIGLIIAVGAITSLFYVLIILPQLLTIFDKWITKSKFSEIKKS